LGDGNGGQEELVGEENEAQIFLDIVVVDAA